MLEYCIKVYETYVGMKKVHTNSHYAIIPDTELKQVTREQITWSNLNYLYHKYGLMLPFNVWNRKKGRQICFFNRQKSIKEWKSTSVNMYIQVHYEKRKATLNDILKFYNSDIAIEYLTERGMKIVQNYY